MYVASDLAKIAKNNGLSSVAGVDQSVGTPLAKDELRSFTTLTRADGVYYSKAAGVLVVTKSGVTLDGIDFRGVSINVQADNVTIKNSSFDASKGIYAINAFPGTTNLTVDHSTFDGLKLDKINFGDFVTSRGENTVLTNNAFLDAPADAVSIQSGTIAGNYFAGSGYATGAHADAIWIGKTIGPVVITDNVIDWRSRADAPTETNEAIRITGENGNVSDVTVTKNILLGGSMTVLVSDGATQTHSASQVGSVTDVTIKDNVVDYGKYGSLEQTSRPADLVYADNNHASGMPVTPGAEAAGTLPTLSALHQITSTRASAILKGTSAADYLHGGSGIDRISGGAGNDVIEGGNGRDYLSGGAGKDIFIYRSVTTSGKDLISDFTHGVDRIDLATLAGAPSGPEGWQWLGADGFTGHAWQLHYLVGSSSTIVEVDVNGDLKADLQIELAGKVTLTTSDFILGAAATSPSIPTTPVTPPEAPPVTTTPTPPSTPAEEPLPTLVLHAPATGGNVTGQAGDELILGSAKNDVIRGAAGDDVLVGGHGRDFLFGGSGADTFKFAAATDSTGVVSGRDYIGDFTHGQDHIDLRGLDASTATSGDQALHWIGADHFGGNAGELRYTTIQGGAQVQADLNGDGIVDFAIDMATKTVLTASDFLL